MRQSRASLEAPFGSSIVPVGARVIAYFRGEQKMYVMAVSTISDHDKFWNALKQAYSQLPREARWTLAVGSTDGTRAVNVIVHDSIASVRSFFEKHAGSFGTTEYFEAD